MSWEHSGAGVSHHRSNSLAHRRAVAVDGALRAGRLVRPERAPFEPLQSVVEKGQALFARRVGRVVMRSAEDLDHCRDGFRFA